MRLYGALCVKEGGKVCVCESNSVSFIYSSAGRSADASEKEQRQGKSVRGRMCEIKSREDKEKQKFIPPGIPSVLSTSVSLDEYIKHAVRHIKHG